jgi:hypothetical protein
MAERLSNLGYISVVKEVTRGVPLTPTDSLLAYDENISTNGGFVDITPSVGQKFKTYNTLQGVRSHKGEITFSGEPNTTARMADILLTKISTTGAGPYTHVFGFSPTANPNSMTIDISYGNVVARYWGVEASKLAPVYNANEMQWKMSVSALGSFQGREIATVATTTLTLKTDYDPTPNKGLVIGDLVRIYKQSTGATLDTTIATVNADGITVTLGASAAAFAPGDMITLRPATPALNNLPSFLWSKTQYIPGTSASVALTNPQLRVEQGSSFDIMHSFKSDDGEARSGSFDPASLARTTGDANLTIKRFFDNPDDVTLFNNLGKTAWQIRMYSGSANQYECRLTFNHVKTDGMVVPNLKSNDIVYSDLKTHPIYDPTDSQAILLTVINALPTI